MVVILLRGRSILKALKKEKINADIVSGFCPAQRQLQLATALDYRTQLVVFTAPYGVLQTGRKRFMLFLLQVLWFVQIYDPHVKTV